MSAQEWCWSNIVNPQLADAAIVAQQRRAKRRRANDDDATGHGERKPAAA